MKLHLENENYCCTLVKIETIIPLENCDNVVSTPFFWYTAIVGKDTKVWDVGILFTAEVQLSEAYCKENNLFREPTFNANPEMKGYIENNRRVKAMKFRGNKSSALFMPLESLEYLWDTSFLLWSDQVSFNSIDWVEICKKYEIPVRNSWHWNKTRGKTKVFKRIDNKTFPEHYDTTNYFRNSHMYQSVDFITISQKLHWSSGRFWYVKTRKELNRYEKLLKRIMNISDMEYNYIYWSRKVIKNGNAEKEKVQWFYKSDIWKTMMERYKAHMPKDYIFYGEVIWWAGEAPIQKWYTYDLAKWECELYIYRIAIVNDDWLITDLPMQYIKSFCIMNWFKFVPILWMWYHKDFDVHGRLDVAYYPKYVESVPLCKESPCDEWIVVRKEWLEPYTTKAKSSDFLEYESSRLNKWVADMESLESNQNENEEQ